MLSIESVCDEEWEEWYRMTPQDRWLESERLDPEPDSQSPFYDESAWGPLPSHGGTGLRSVRRSGV